MQNDLKNRVLVCAQLKKTHCFEQGMTMFFIILHIRTVFSFNKGIAFRSISLTKSCFFIMLYLLQHCYASMLSFRIHFKVTDNIISIKQFYTRLL